MYHNKVRTKVRRRILVDRAAIRQVVRETGISRNTIRKILRNQARKLDPPPHRVCKGRHVIQTAKRLKDKNAAFEWMRSILQKEIGSNVLSHQIGNLPDLGELLRHLYDGTLVDRNRSMAVLSNRHGLSTSVICRFLGIERKTARRYLKVFGNTGASGLFSRRTSLNRKFDDPSIKTAVFELLHEPPSNYGINRTTWTTRHLVGILKKKERPVCAQVIRKIVKLAGYKWRKARIVLTSNDPRFSEKLNRIKSILSGLRRDEAFFSIDEFGPFAVKMKPGLALTAPGEQRIVPQWQKSRGCLILTAALELSENQVHHFFSTKKNTAEMIRMMDLLIDRYRDRSKIYLSWDAASWHISKALYKRIEAHNSEGRKPVVNTAPLPSGSQFLNVIESVFSGMARAIIHSSDYKSSDAAKAAINTYFIERNANFKEYPRRAGKKIWRDEREPATFSVSNNCKDPRYR